jgi:glycosyltransferase involved in cell wall biosynthesis
MILVVFSKDRPLQLEAALSSFRRHCQDAGAVEVKVLYKADISRMSSLYRQAAREHPEVDFVRESDFRRDLRLLLQGHDEIGFLVDDTVFVRPFSMRQIVGALASNTDALGFSLRLGRNTTYCYSLDRAQKEPEFQCEGGVCKFRWPSAECDFGYPLELSSSIYRAKQLMPLLEILDFHHPNTLEGVLFANIARFRDSHPALLCFPQSAAFSIPANRTQSVCENRFGGRPDYSVEALAELFARGSRIDTAALDGMVPRAVHQEVAWEFRRGSPAVPLVSVVIPCYNQAAFLPEAVASVAAQTFKDLEIIIVNDGSTDATETTARGLMAQYPELKLRLLQKRNEGLAQARNDGVAAAAGAYILPLDADDRIASAMLEKTVGLLASRPAIAIAYTDVVHFGQAQKTIQAAEYDFDKICRNNQLNYCSLFRREAWETAGGYNPNMIWGYEDWDFWISCGEAGLKAARVPEPLLHYRVKENSMYTAAIQHDAELRARIVLNHPRCYEGPQVASARGVWKNAALPAPNGAPKVSVIVPAYNRPNLLEAALRSILAQSFRDFEIIVVNDCGADIEHVVTRMRAQGRIVHLRHPANRGLAAARNTGCRFARGKFLAYLDDDDTFLPDHLETLVTFLEGTGNKAAYTDAFRAQEKREEGRNVAHRDVAYSSDWDNDQILISNLAPVLCFMHERTLGIAVGEFDESLTTHEDWDYWIRLSRICQPVHIKKVTCEFRVVSDASTMTSRLRPDFLRTAQIIFRKYKSYAAGKEEVLRRQKRVLRKLRRDLGPQGLGSWFRSVKQWLASRGNARDQAVGTTE